MATFHVGLVICWILSQLPLYRGQTDDCLSLWISPLEEHRENRSLFLDISHIRAQNDSLFVTAGVLVTESSPAYPTDEIRNENMDKFSRIVRHEARNIPPTIVVQEHEPNFIQKFEIFFPDNDESRSALQYFELSIKRISCSFSRDFEELSRGEQLLWSSSLLALSEQFGMSDTPLYLTVYDSGLTGLVVRPLDILPRSQVGQELVVLEHLQYKPRGKFLDIGASDGVLHSNTFSLEKYMGWTGLLIEPLRQHASSLATQRPNSQFINACVYNETKSARFMAGKHSETVELSGLASEWLWSAPRTTSSEKSEHAIDDDFRVITVPCFEINLLLQIYDLWYVDFLSIDVEGADIAIVQAIDWNRFSAEVVTIECHVREKNREAALRQLFLIDLGYAFMTRVHWDLMFFKSLI